MQVELRHDELQQPFGRQTPGGGVTGGRGHRLLQDGASQSFHLWREGLPARPVKLFPLILKEEHKNKERIYLCGSKDNPVVVLSSTGAFLLLPSEADGHRAEAIVNPKEILVFCNKIAE